MRGGPTTGAWQQAASDHGRKITTPEGSAQPGGRRERLLPRRHDLRRLWSYARPYRLAAWLSAALMLVSTAATLAGPYLTGRALDDAIIPRDERALTWYVVAFLGAAVLGLVAGAAQSYLVQWAGERVLLSLRTDVHGHIQRLGFDVLSRERAGRLLTRLTNDIDALQQLVVDGVTTLIVSLVTVGGVAVILVYLDWRLALATLVVFPVLAVATGAFRVYSARAYRRVRERISLVTAHLAETLAGMRVVQGFGRERRNLADFTAANEQYRRANMDTVYLSGVYFPAVEWLSALGTVVVLGVGGVLATNGDVEIGVILSFLLYLSFFFDPIQQLSQLYNTVQAASAALEKIFDLLDLEPSVTDRPDARDLPDDIEGRVDFTAVGFSYGDEEVLEDVDLHVPAGATVALVGETGAGKSTIIKLLLRFYDPDRGSVAIDGHDLRDVTQRSIRGRIGVVPQEGFLFAGTIAENIRFGRPGATDEEVAAAAHAVGADVVADGLETDVQERGSRLSAGERQLVCLARALLVDPRILVLDEATSSIDPGTERRIEAGMRTLLAGRTAVVIAHRLSTIRNADLICVIEGGRVVEQGTHDQLVATGGHYATLHHAWSQATALRPAA